MVVSSLGSFHLPRLGASGLETVTKSLTPEANARVRRFMAENKLCVIGENSRLHVLAVGDQSFHKSMTADAARRLESFYPALEQAKLPAGHVPPHLSMAHLDDAVSVASFEWVEESRPGLPSDTLDCLAFYAELQLAGARALPEIARGIADVCRSEVGSWNEDLLLHDQSSTDWHDPKILAWGHVDAPSLPVLGVPALRAVAELMQDFSPSEICAPVHADLYVGNLMRIAEDRLVVVDWDDGYWGPLGMGLQILLREGLDVTAHDLTMSGILAHAPAYGKLGLGESDLLTSTIASAVIEVAGVRQSLREMGRPASRHGAYLAAWACRYRWLVELACSDR